MPEPRTSIASISATGRVTIAKHNMAELRPRRKTLGLDSKLERTDQRLCLLRAYSHTFQMLGFCKLLKILVGMPGFEPGTP